VRPPCSVLVWAPSATGRHGSGRTLAEGSKGAYITNLAPARRVHDLHRRRTRPRPYHAHIGGDRASLRVCLLGLPDELSLTIDVD
jgi:hypothetical protein